MLGAIAGYELLRYLVIGRMRRRIRAGAIQFIRTYRIQLEAARFIDRVWVRERLALDPTIDRTVLEVAEKTGEPIDVLRMRVDDYVEEIAPYFSVTAYYRFGAWLAKSLVDFCFELVVDTDEFDRQAAAVPEDAIRVYVINHRSNTDSVVLAFGLLRHMALSYAVGEWALVWPLHHLFRLFGSYFVRRGEKDPIYHIVLERFVQLHVAHGGVTGFFVEGGLSRDGALRPPKAGLLDYLIGVRREHPDREIYFLPVGVNYDRTLEDRTLVAERDGPLPRASAYRRLMNVFGILFWLPLLIGANLLQVATRSHRKFGYAAINFGEPLHLTDWPGGATLHRLGDLERRPAVEALAAELLVRRIGRVVPATPVAVLCCALLRSESGSLSEVTHHVRGLLAELRAVGAPIALGRAFDDIRRREEERRLGSGIPGVDDEVAETEEAEMITLLARHLLQRRRVVLLRQGALRIQPKDRPIVEYYANSIRHHLERKEEAEAAEAEQVVQST